MDGEFLSILGTMVILFFDISMGYIAKKAHVMDKAGDKGLSKLILNTALPAMILGSVLTADSLPESTEILITMGLSIISFAIMTALAFLEREKADYMITIDADGQHYPEDLPAFLELLVHCY